MVNSGALAESNYTYNKCLFNYCYMDKLFSFASFPKVKISNSLTVYESRLIIKKCEIGLMFDRRVEMAILMNTYPK